MSKVRIYVDGAAKPTNTEVKWAGGWAFIVYNEDETELIKKVSGSLIGTNNISELIAIIAALNYSVGAKFSQIVIVTDSQYCIQGITDWIDDWKTNNWMTAAGTPVKNKIQWETIQRLIDQLTRNNQSLEWEWVKGHSGNLGNDLVDKLASKAAENFKKEVTQSAR